MTMTMMMKLGSSLLLLVLSFGAEAFVVVPQMGRLATMTRLHAEGDSTLTWKQQASSLIASPQQQRYEEKNEWHDSFSRNGLADFVPPAAAFMNCLVVGGNEHSQANALPFMWEPEAIPASPLLPDSDSPSSVHVDVHPLLVNDDNNNIIHEGHVSSQELEATIANLLEEENTNIRHEAKQQPLYDCILDRGLMDQIILEGADDAAVRDLLQNASRAIQEHGIYVFVTQRLSAPVKEYLTEVGESIGLAWEFDLDGISNEGMSVSAARKFFNDPMPHSGLSTVGP
jgi:hypothetical protein